MEYIKKAREVLCRTRDTTIATWGGDSSEANSRLQDQVGPDGQRRCHFFDDERSEPHPECCKCDQILKKPPPCVCDLCHALNFQVPSASTTPKQGAKGSTQPPATQARQTSHDDRRVRMQQQGSNSMESVASSADWVRVDLVAGTNGKS
ncbi:hypothetical protein MAPG_08558 [Magnaporthiopsis poae ATCC 64411]|uniref:Uncharacterized protein n=1 Tax=Magnaporthiopsis poae (strain ATCC 64411 / 73-15) TaxID=644358 RepID=A0A0C4E7P2_MAGP6|nr:hypothetical protein MAPG_08558 [Magnaporthiopsis poae ATCC 64411]